MLYRLTGPVERVRVHVEFLDGGGQHRKVALDRVMPRGTVVKLGSFPPFYFWLESKRGSSRKMSNTFASMPFFEPGRRRAAPFADAVKSCPKCSGFVVDLRGNPGGLGGLAMGVGGWFIDKNGLQLGTMMMRGTKLNFVLFPRPEAFPRPARRAG